MKNIYEIKLDKGFGYGYVELIYGEDILPNFDILINIFCKYSISPLREDVKIFKEIDFLISPTVTDQLPKKRKDANWKLLESSESHIHVTIPNFKDNPDTKSWHTINWEELRWYSFDNMDVRCLEGYDYAQVKHLPYWFHISPQMFLVRLTMIWIKRNGLLIEDYYDFEKENWTITAIYYEVMNSVFYDEIDSAIIGKPIGQPQWYEM